MLQLNPLLPFLTEDGRHCTAYFALDYSPDHSTLFLVGFDDNRELWWLSQTKLRIVDNVTMDRLPLAQSTLQPNEVVFAWLQPVLDRLNRLLPAYAKAAEEASSISDSVFFKGRRSGIQEVLDMLIHRSE